MNELPKIKKSQIGLNEVLSIQADSIMESLNCHNIGKIINFYPETQTADIQILVLKQIQEEVIIPSILANVPLIVYGTANAHITLPNPTGSLCLLFFIDRDIDAFLDTEAPYVPVSPRMHDFSDCIALTTFKTPVNPISNYDENAITIEYENSTIKVKDEINLDANSDVNIDAQSEIHLKSPIKVVIDAPEVDTTGNLNVGTGYTGVIACGATSIQVTNGIITGVV